MTTRRADTVMASVLLAVMLAAFCWSLSYGPSTRELPELVSGVGAVALIAYLVTSNLTGVRLKSASDAIAASPTAGESDAEPEHGNAGPRAQPVGSLGMGLTLPVIYLSTFVVLGLVPSVFVFVAGYSWCYGKAAWPKAVLAGTVVALLVYLLFLAVFKYPLYEGLVTRWL